MSTIEQLKQRMDEQLRARETLKAKVAEDVQNWRKREKALVEKAEKVTAELARWKEMSMKHEAAAHHAADRISELEEAVESFQRDAKTAAEAFRKKAEKELASLQSTESPRAAHGHGKEVFRYRRCKETCHCCDKGSERSRQQLEEVHASGAAARKEAEDARRNAKSSTEKLVSVEQHHREVLMKMEDDMDKLRREMGRELRQLWPARKRRKKRWKPLPRSTAVWFTSSRQIILHAASWKMRSVPHKPSQKSTGDLVAQEGLMSKPSQDEDEYGKAA